jgi:hypothetical protein
MASMDMELQVYNVNKCGLFSNEKKSELHLLSLGELVKDLRSWAIDSKKKLAERNTYDDNGRVKKSYCLDIEEQDGHFMIAFWNSVSDESKSIGVLSKKASNEQGIIIGKAKINDDEIAGFPSFFWVIPASNIVVAVRFGKQSYGVTQFREYMRSYFGFSSYYKRGEGYTNSSKSSEIEDNRIVNRNLQPHFSISIDHVTADLDKIIERFDSITKVVKDVSVENYVNSGHGFVEQIKIYFDKLEPTKKKKIRIQMPVSLSKKQVKEMIDKYRESDGSSSDNVGFVFKGSSSIEWLKGCYNTKEIQMDLDFSSHEYPNLRELLSKLKDNFSLCSLKDDRKDEQRSA